MLDDPFRGGKAILSQAGITVTRREEWERGYLKRVMDFYARWFGLFAACHDWLLSGGQIIF